MIRNLEYQNQQLKKEVEELKSQVEDMRACSNCKHVQIEPWGLDCKHPDGDYKCHCLLLDLWEYGVTDYE